MRKEAAIDTPTNVNIFPAIPTIFFMCLPTRERMAMSRLIETFTQGDQLGAVRSIEPPTALTSPTICSSLTMRSITGLRMSPLMAILT